MIYHPDARIVIHTPPRSGGASLAMALKEYGWKITNHLPELNNPLRILLLRHPLSRTKSIYRQLCNPPVHRHRLPFKFWLKATPPPAQTTYCERPNLTLRLEYLANDLKDASIKHTSIPRINTSPPREIHACMASRAHIRSLYARDYDLGDYE